MKPLASLSNRIFLASALLTVVSTGVAVYVVSRQVTREAEVELERGLRDAGGLVDQQLRATSAQYVLFARLVADLPKFKGAVETQHRLTVEGIAPDYRRQLNADLLVITGRQGQVLAWLPGPEPPQGPPASVRRALAGLETVEYLPAPGGILEVVTVPVAIGLETPEMFGTLSVGFLLDQGLAEQLGRGTRSRVAFLLDGRVRAATLPEAEWPALGPLAGGDGIARLAFADGDYVALAHPLTRPAEAPVLEGGAVPVALVLQSRTEQVRFLRAVNTALVVATIATILIATLLSFAVARTVTRPLADITDAMREMAATGDLTRKIAVRGPRVWQDEDAELLAATFNTLTESIDRFQREAAQKERLLSLGRLSTVIAHEIRNPLMIIKAALRTLRAPASAADAGEAVRDIDGEVERLDRIVHEVLDFARPIRYDLAPTDLVRLCRDAAASTFRRDEGVEAALDLPAEPLVVATDGERLRAALVNVLANARQAVLAREAAAVTAGGPPEPPREAPVRLALSSAGRGARITIADRGPGIASNDLPHIFEPYFTTRRTGTGLGLPIARNIIEGLGGSIAVQTGADGTIIDVVLPPAAPASAGAMDRRS